MILMIGIPKEAAPDFIMGIRQTGSIFFLSQCRSTVEAMSREASAV